MSGDIANKDEALKCMAIARRAMQEGDVAKALKFAEKAYRLYKSPEVEHFLKQIRGGSQQGAAAHSAEPASNGASDASGHGGSHSRSNGHAGHAHASEHRPHGSSHAHASGPSHGHHTSGTPHAESSGRPSAKSPLRHRAGHAHDAAASEDQGTPDQRKMVQQILKAKDMYEILGLQRNASDDDIKKSYRKLALKLHPDKNHAPKADDAFKAVGKAFTILSDPDKRAYYDRTGYESTQAAAAAASASAAAQQQHYGGPFRGPGGMYYSEDFDPEEIFNMFFGGLNPNARVFRTHFGGAPQRRQPQQQGQGGAGAQSGGFDSRMLFGLLQFAPILLILLFTFFTGSSPSYSFQRDVSRFPEEMHTSRLQVPFWVKSTTDMNKGYPHGSTSRYRLERQIEQEYYERISVRCQQEKQARHRQWTWGSKDAAKNMPMQSCDELDRLHQKLGYRPGNSYW